MKNLSNPICALSILLLLGVAACQKTETAEIPALSSGKTFYAAIEDGSDTKVYADADLHVLWDADDRVSIFCKNTYNQQYRFDGNTSDNSGSFSEVPTGTFVTGNQLDLNYAVYPYRPTTSISNSGVLSVTLPAEQAYREGNTFGPGANLMVSASSDNHLLFRNVCGYLALKLYGNGVSVSSITLKGNGEEPLSGEATVTMAAGGTPALAFSGTTGKTITLTCATPVALSASAQNPTVFWFVLPPTTFANGFTVTVHDANGGIFAQSTSKSFQIVRNNLSTMAPIEVVPESIAPLPGIFTVNGRHFQFSKGNLQAVLNNGVITRWKFADHQWEVTGDVTSLVNETGTVDEFYLATSAPLSRWGIHIGADDMMWQLQDQLNGPEDFPYDQYIADYYSGEITPQWENPDFVAEYGEGWIPLEPLFSGILMTFNYHETGSHGYFEDHYTPHCAPATVEGTPGIVLIPDGYVQPSGIDLNFPGDIVYQSSVGVYHNLDSVTNTYTASQWTAMEQAGAVFLP